MVKREDLETVYLLARANKRRSEDAILFEKDQEKRISQLCIKINERTYRCNDNYTFISMRPQPREVFGCEFESRMIQWYVVWRILPYLEEALTSRTYNNRKGMGTLAAVAQVQDDIFEVSMGFTREAWAIQWDLTGCFPNAVCEIAYQKLRRLIEERYEGEDKEDLLWMAMIAIHANPAQHCYRKTSLEQWNGNIKPEKSLFTKEPGIGGAIGFLIWQIVMNLYFDEVDHWAVDEMGLYYTRFVDDSCVITTDKAEVLHLLPHFREMYAEVGASMHPNKFSCQPIDKGVKFLGTYLKCDRAYIANRTIRRAHIRIHEMNQCKCKVAHIEEFIATVNSYLGIMKYKCEFNNITKLWEHVSGDWKKYVDMDWERKKIVTKEGFKHRDLLERKFKLITGGV